MASKSEVFKPGDTVPASGVYSVIHEKLDGEYHADPHQVTAIGGMVFPRCRACQDWVTFQLHLPAQHVEAHDHFKS